MTKKAIKLGNEVKDVVSGFIGIAVSKVEYINGCIQFGVQPQSKDGTLKDSVYFDDKRLAVIGKGVSIRTTDTGGVMSHDCPKH